MGQLLPTKNQPIKPANVNKDDTDQRTFFVLNILAIIGFSFLAVFINYDVVMITSIVMACYLIVVVHGYASENRVIIQLHLIIMALGFLAFGVGTVFLFNRFKYGPVQLGFPFLFPTAFLVFNILQFNCSLEYRDLIRRKSSTAPANRTTREYPYKVAFASFHLAAIIAFVTWACCTHSDDVMMACMAISCYLTIIGYGFLRSRYLIVQAHINIMAIGFLIFFALSLKAFHTLRYQDSIYLGFSGVLIPIVLVISLIHFRGSMTYRDHILANMPDTGLFELI